MLSQLGANCVERKHRGVLGISIIPQNLNLAEELAFSIGKTGFNPVPNCEDDFVLVDIVGQSINGNVVPIF